MISTSEIPRRKSHKVRIGNVCVGGNAPVAVQSMTNTDTADRQATIAQVLALARAGSELVRVTVNTKTRAEIMQMTDIFRAKIVDVQPKSLTIEITGDESKIDKFLRLMNTFGVLELTRTGKIALARKP